MSNILEFRAGNIIEYWGPFGRQNVIIKSITKLDGSRQKFELQLTQDEDSLFNGYSEQVSPIFFREQHLSDLEFEFDENQKTHSLLGLTLSAFFFTEGTDRNNLTLGFTHYNILPIGFVLPTTKEQLKEKGIEIPFVHALQNFCSDQNINIDFSKIF